MPEVLAFFPVHHGLAGGIPVEIDPPRFPRSRLKSRGSKEHDQDQRSGQGNGNAFHGFNLAQWPLRVNCGQSGRIGPHPRPGFCPGALFLRSRPWIWATGDLKKGFFCDNDGAS